MRRSVFLPMVSCLITLSACHLASARDDRDKPFNQWYGYRVGDILDPADIQEVLSDGDTRGPENPHHHAGPRFKFVKLKSKGDWPWDDATAALGPGNVVTALNFFIAACDPGPIVETEIVETETFAGKPPEMPPRKCWKSSSEMARLGHALAKYVTDRIVPQPKDENGIPDPEAKPNPTQNSFNFNQRWTGCEDEKPVFRSNYRDPTGKVGDVEFYIYRENIWMNVKSRKDKIYVDGSPLDPDTARGMTAARCAHTHPQYLSFQNISLDQQNSPNYRGGTRITREDYPDHEKLAGHPKALIVKLIVRPDGTVKNCSIDRSSGISDLDNMSCKLVSERFKFTESSPSADHTSDRSGDYSLHWPF